MLGVAGLVWAGPAACQAEMIELRDGRQIEAKIIRRMENLVTIEWQPGWTEDIPIGGIARIGEERLTGKDAKVEELGYDMDLLRWGLRFKPPADWGRLA